MTGANAYQCEVGRRLDKAKREELILENLPLVHWIAARLHETLPASIPLEDLVSEGIVGLIAAVDNFDPSYNAKLGTYAHHRIRGAILDSVRGADGLSGPKRQKVKKVEAAIRALEQELQRVPVEEEIAAKLGLSLDDYRQWLVELRGVRIGTIEPAGDGKSEGALYFLSGSDEYQPGRHLEREQFGRVLEEGINKLPKKERLVLSLYYKDELTLREIASIMEVHLTRIFQLKAQGVLRLKAYIQRYWPMKSGVHR